MEFEVPEHPTVGNVSHSSKTIPGLATGTLTVVSSVLIIWFFLPFSKQHILQGHSQAFLDLKIECLMSKSF